MSMARAALFTLTLAALLAGCTGRGPQVSSKVRGDRAFEKGDHLEASEHYRSYLESGLGSEDVADAQFMLARSYYELEDYPSAALEFEIFARNYPRADSLEAAAFYSALCWYQQSPRYDRDSTPTVQAIRKLEDYLLDFPGGAHRAEGELRLHELYDKMARKTLEIARFYRRIGRDEAAAIYFEKLLVEQPESGFVGEALEELAKIQEDLGKGRQAAETREALRSWEESRSP